MHDLPWKLLSMRDGVTLFGSTAEPRWTAQEISKAAGSLFSFLAISTTLGSSTTLWDSVSIWYGWMALGSESHRGRPKMLFPRGL